MCDLSKAFDSVTHKILLDKCAQLNIDSFWFESYLSDRAQSVRLKQKLSDRLNVSYGVPQGSVLDPILFSIYVNDLAKRINSCCLVQYADDTQFLHADTIYNINDLTSGEAVAEILACGPLEPVVPGSIPGRDKLGFFG